MLVWSLRQLKSCCYANSRCSTGFPSRALRVFWTDPIQPFRHRCRDCPIWWVLLSGNKCSPPSICPTKQSSNGNNFQSLPAWGRFEPAKKLERKHSEPHYPSSDLSLVSCICKRHSSMRQKDSSTEKDDLQGLHLKTDKQQTGLLKWRATSLELNVVFLHQHQVIVTAPISDSYQ